MGFRQYMYGMLGVLVLFNVAYADSKNPFEDFVGTYKVEKQICYYFSTPTSCVESYKKIVISKYSDEQVKAAFDNENIFLLDESITNEGDVTVESHIAAITDSVTWTQTRTNKNDSSTVTSTSSFTMLKTPRDGSLSIKTSFTSEDVHYLEIYKIVLDSDAGY